MNRPLDHDEDEGLTEAAVWGLVAFIVVSSLMTVGALAAIVYFVRVVL